MIRQAAIRACSAATSVTTRSAAASSTVLTGWERPVPVNTSPISWRHHTDRKRVDDGSASRSNDAVSLVRKLEALRLINVGNNVGALWNQQPADQQQSGQRTLQMSNNNNGVSVPEGYSAMNRNNRKPKKANHGARPCSRYARRGKRRRWGNPRR